MSGYLTNWAASSTILSNSWSTTTTAVPLIVFSPTGSGQLWYHAIPAALSQVPVYGYANYPQAMWANPYQANLRPVAPPLLRPALIHAGRRALRRSIDLLRRFRPERDVKAFLDGHPLVLHGHRYDYLVRSRGNLLEHTMNPRGPHIPYDLHIVAKDGRTLAKGCVIVPETPVVDQVLALALHVQDEEAEDVIVRTTNWTPRLPALQRAA
jgi:hypothetical protein